MSGKPRETQPQRIVRRFKRGAALASLYRQFGRVQVDRIIRHQLKKWEGRAP